MNEPCPLRDSVLACDGHALVTGGPGSGKTTIALRKAVKRIQQGMTPGQSALFLSFSRAAVARILDAAKLEATAAEQEQLSIQTFHSFFWDILKAHAYLLGAPRKLSILLPQDEKALSGGIDDKDDEWEQWLVERERLFHEEGRIAFDLFAPNATRLLATSGHLLSSPRGGILSSSWTKPRTPANLRGNALKCLHHTRRSFASPTLNSKSSITCPALGPSGSKRFAPHLIHSKSI